ncbi:pentatricopeptide repeat-containing protein At4g30825, chloroplastic [Amaranthus tricolor]|uniref:pentatricopeptide repeat-containing protein At4g30825, chloroplastic n=1 Tax=Amaranthus tricolor TaxID=29722 RepID=UPI00258B33A9|nr:pentatricopeptide repeat-containing protein At4g30825, chloroplastic [Amaranthus tricolor]XP_057537060.1 pentatricopeptide repeat-containing protein At4g30825, chloroplastic [Amaranthus tricolor]XP_057537061.1 pentatricopeptide repeat-containing protein At4g30825, chloroplastic [Amaranthus tricolor]XP_057537062.1 pentatricopeptide repeat-containing protein At4g30825, chloroplastic [Amaranthus tricolor]XP_057537063.1 pentatricopeptide repeat-containing protein At4g30825, chloroplastic [Amaran
MASLQFSVCIDSYEPKKLNFYLSSVQLFDRTPGTRFLNSANGGGSCVIFAHSKQNRVKGARFKSELVDSSMNGGQVDSSVRSFGDDLGGENSVDTNFSSHRVVGARYVRKRFCGARGIRKEESNLKLDPLGKSNDKVYDVCHELDVGNYGVGSESSVAYCNKVLKGLEKGEDSQAMKFFDWMRTNGKLIGNVIAYNLALRVLGRRGDWDAAMNLIEEMRSESRCELEFQVFNTIIYACSKKGLVDIGAKWFRLMLEYDVEPNIATFGMLMSLYQKGWNVDEAEFAFFEMRRLDIRCQSAYSAMITIYTRLGLYVKAEEIIDMLFKDKVVMNVENWLVVLNAYSQQGKLEEAESLLVSMREGGFPPNIIAYNTLITGYGKVSNMDAAEQMFQNLQNVGLQPDETTYRSMIEGWARFGNNEKAKWYYKRLKDLGFTPTSSNLYSLMNLSAKQMDEDGAIMILDDMVKLGCQPSSILGSLLQAYEKFGRFDKFPQILRGSLHDHVLDNQTACSILAMAYVKYSLVDDAIMLLKCKRWKDPAFEDNLFHLLICSCKEMGHLENSVKIFTHMLTSDKHPNMHILSTMIDIYSSMNQFSNANSTYQLLKSSGLAMDMVAYSIVIRMYVKFGYLGDANYVLDEMDKQGNIVPDVYLLRDMLRVYQRCNKQNRLADLYYKILKSGVTWDQEMYNCVINCCAHALPVDELSRLFSEMTQKGFVPNTTTYNVMLDVYGKSKLFKKASKIFWMAKNQGLVDEISYNTLIAAYGRSKKVKKMRKTVRLMQFNGFSVSLEAYNSMLNAYGKVGHIDKFKSVLQRLKESSYTSDHYTYNILINIYGEQGWIEEVATVLTELKKYGLGPDLCSYNTLIKAYGIAGMVEEAVGVIKEMRHNGVDPDRITYVNLISALRKNDKFLEAVRWSLWMKQMGLS